MATRSVLHRKKTGDGLFSASIEIRCPSLAFVGECLSAVIRGRRSRRLQIVEEQHNIHEGVASRLSARVLGHSSSLPIRDILHPEMTM
jgi:hypothetical protein